MKTKHTRGNWKVGRAGTVVTDKKPKWLTGHTGHEDKEYYGGYLIAESIMNPYDAEIMAAAPEMFKSLVREAYISGALKKVRLVTKILGLKKEITYNELADLHVMLSERPIKKATE